MFILTIRFVEFQFTDHSTNSVFNFSDLLFLQYFCHGCFTSIHLDSINYLVHNMPISILS